ncbi:MAG: branched-chain amino acid transporter permease [Lachnospiraceae bacterium]
MHTSFWNSVLIVAVAAAATFLTRVIPFAAFGKRKIPQTVDYLGRILPPAIIATLVVYCLRNVDFISGYHGAAEIRLRAICVLHLWRRNTLLSVGGGTVVYMI